MTKLWTPGTVFRRGSPENIVASLAAGRSVTPGKDVWGAWAQNVASLSANSILAALAFSTRIVSTSTGAAISTSRRIWVEVGTGAAASEVAIRRAQFGGGAVVNAVNTASAQTPVLEQAVLAPKYIPSGTRIATRGYQTPDTAAAERVYLIMHDLTVLSCLSRLQHPLRDFTEGIGYDVTDDIPDTAETTLVQSASAFTFGSYAQIIASLADNYLITGISYASGGTDLNNDVQIDIALGAAASEVIHARAAFPCGLGVALPWSAGRPFQFPIPWLAMKGERISARAAGSNGAASNIPIRLEGIRLGNSGAIA